MKSVSTSRIVKFAIAGFLVGLIIVDPILNVLYIPIAWYIIPLALTILFVIIGRYWHRSPANPLPSDSSKKFNLWRVLFVLSVIFVPVTILFLLLDGSLSGLGCSLPSSVRCSASRHLFYGTAAISVFIHAGSIFLFYYLSRLSSK